MRKSIFYIAILLFLFGTNALAQDPQFSQFYSAPIYLNPAFAGNTTQGRVVLNYRNQWPALPAKFVSYAASFDYNFADLNSGVALALQQDRAGSAGLRYTNAAIHYAYDLRITRSLAFKPGLYLSYTFRDINYNELVFGDQIIYDNNTSLSASQFTAEPVRYPDVGTGFLFYTRNFWGGMAFHHVNRPNQSLISQEARLPMRFSMHAGYNLALKKNVKNKEISSFTFVANFKSQGKWDQLDLGTYFRYKIVTSGLFYRGVPLFKRNGFGYPNHDALVALLGVEYKDFSFGYTYDLTISRLVTDSGGAHEISLIYEFASDRAKRKSRRSRFKIPCAKF